MTFTNIWRKSACPTGRVNNRTILLPERTSPFSTDDIPNLFPNDVLQNIRSCPTTPMEDSIALLQNVGMQDVSTSTRSSLPLLVMREQALSLHVRIFAPSDATLGDANVSRDVSCHLGMVLILRKIEH